MLLLLHRKIWEASSVYDYFWNFMDIEILPNLTVRFQSGTLTFFMEFRVCHSSKYWLMIQKRKSPLFFAQMMDYTQKMSTYFTQTNSWARSFNTWTEHQGDSYSTCGNMEFLETLDEVNETWHSCQQVFRWAKNSKQDFSFTVLTTRHTKIHRY